MTDEQIKQNAEEWADEQKHTNSTIYVERYCAYIAGAHSRDEEIEKLERRIYELHENSAGLTNNLTEMSKELNKLLIKLSNPWISIEERLPETGDDIIYLMNSGTPGRNQRYRKFDAEWFRMNVRHWQYANDPKLKKGE